MAKFKNELYRMLVEEVEDYYLQDYIRDRSSADLEYSIEYAINLRREQIMEEEDWENVDEDELMDILFTELSNDIDEDELIERAETPYRGLSDYERNYDIV